MTAPGALEVVDLSGLDFEPDVECEAWDSCGARAVWVARHVCCGEMYPSCEKCRVRTLQVLARMSVPVCTACRAPASAASVVFEPIGGGR